MRHYDLFNGDADGLCALIQLRLVEPRESTLITGVKRDIALVKQVPADEPASVTVLDVSLDKNRDAVDALLAAGSEISYIDHHFPGEQLPDHPKFKAHIDTDPLTCTSLLVDQQLNGRYRNWAITAAYGDNLIAVADQLAAESGLSKEQTGSLKQLGICLNYNGYGASIEDLLFHPAELFEQLKGYEDPLQLVQEQGACWTRLHQGYEADMAKGLNAPALVDESGLYCIALPNEPWARRVSGVLGNELANARPDSACAVLTEIDAEHYLVSLRAPLSNRSGADEVARQFETGGGRKAAAGINKLPKAEFERLVDSMRQQWSAR
ncbi:DHH family phosphoesterase [Motiliproteus sp. SC1-56]|uniref:DHH family phosphoesterase n=1 Tax=Motiliproteus sp. SC1-56 TaxID=2799565 RepID=UPI001A8E88DE|nr:DHH family phosphoesterase [Motiliproteus sp. SC1-56]